MLSFFKFIRRNGQHLFLTHENGLPRSCLCGEPPSHSVCRFIKIRHSADPLSFPWAMVEGSLSIRSKFFYYSNHRQPFNLSNVWVWDISTITGLAASIHGNLSRCTPAIYRHDNSPIFKCTSSQSRV